MRPSTAASRSASAKTTLGLLPPSSRLTRFRLLLRGRLHDDLAGRVFAGEGDLVDVHVAAEGRAGGRAEAGHDVDDAVGEAGFLGQLRHAQGGQRRLLGGLQDDGAAGRQGRTPLPRLHQQREVPGDDLADDADRLVAGVAEVRPFDGNRLAVDLVGPAGVVAIALDGQRQVGVEGVAVGLAVVERFEGGQFFLCSARSGRRACAAGGRARRRSSSARARPRTLCGRL